MVVYKTFCQLSDAKVLGDMDRKISEKLEICIEKSSEGSAVHT